ncbi:hypothetical protein AB0M43_21315 [Longispora sp. NPDC051575]|uniref:hypothetical protein n=1 Tax=Longispora sp. NPDC051575 TaxID=3154943 RepID=UPI00341ED38D
MRSVVLLVPVAALLLAGCGGQPPSPRPSAAIASSAAPAPRGTSGTLVINQSGAAPARTAWYARVETPDAKPLTEAAFPQGPITLTKELTAGKYRVIAWHRACADVCPTTGEKGLGPLEEVCGATVTVTAGATLTATVTIDAEGTCAVAVPGPTVSPTP